MNTLDRVVIITGAGSGIGKASTLALLKNGFRVVLAGRNAETLEKVIEEAGVTNAKAIAVQADVTCQKSVRALFAKAVEAFGRVDVLFNNAGSFGPQTLLEDVDIAEWQATVDVNVTGPLLCTQEAFKVMKDQSPQGGRIINNGSLSAQTPRPNSVSYTTTKNAINGLTKCTSLDGRKYNIACGQIDIGNTETEMAVAKFGGVCQADLTLKEEPLMPIEDVANAVLYMASLPLESNALSVTVMATKMPFVGRG